MMMTNLMLTFSATDLSLGRVGAPLMCCEFRLQDWPEGRSRWRPGNCMLAFLMGLLFNGTHQMLVSGMH